MGNTKDMKEFAEKSVKEIREQVGNELLLCALSGGVDSSVCAALAHLAVGENLTCIFVDHGLMRKNEGDMIEAAFKGYNFKRVNCKERFLEKLKNISDPEQKRKIIGEEFIAVFEEEAKKLGKPGYLIQGTIYPDIVESNGVKSHHNVGGLPEHMDFLGLVEPLKSLYKNDVRELGRVLGVDESILTRQPFPGPGLGVRVLGEINEEKLELVREADALFRFEMQNANVDANQYFACILEQKSVGAVDGNRTFGYTIALRAVKTIDFMQAQWVRVPYEVLEAAAVKITALKGVGRVVYDITGKPPATIEWE